MSRTETYYKWINTGYELFAGSGPESVQVEKMARILKLNKSGFYHYFGDQEVFFLKIMDYHETVTLQFAKEVSELKSFSPGYPQLLIKYKTALFFQMQLRKHKNIQLFGATFIKTRDRNNKVQIPLWCEYINIADRSVAEETLDLARDILYSRFKLNNITLETMIELFENIRNLIQKLKNLSSASIQN